MNCIKVMSWSNIRRGLILVQISLFAYLFCKNVPITSYTLAVMFLTRLISFVEMFLSYVSFLENFVNTMLEPDKFALVMITKTVSYFFC